MLLLAAALAIQVNVHPSIADEYQLLTRPTPETYTCSVLVKDPEAKKVVANIPKLIVAPGSTETAKSRAGEYWVELTVKVKSATNVYAETADTHVIVHHLGEIVADQESTITLLPRKSGNRFAQ